VPGLTAADDRPDRAALHPICFEAPKLRDGGWPEVELGEANAARKRNLDCPLPSRGFAICPRPP